MLDQQGIAERYDIVIDFSEVHNGFEAPPGELLRAPGRQAAGEDLSRSGFSALRTIRASAGSSSSGSYGCCRQAPDKSLVPGFSETYPASTVVPTSQWPMSPFMIPNPDHSQLPVSAERTFEFNRGANADHVGADLRRRSVGHFGQQRRHAGRRLRPHLGGAEDGHARNLAPQQRRRRLGSSHPHPLRRGADPRARRPSATSRWPSAAARSLPSPRRGPASITCSSATSPALTWSTATTPSTRTPRCAAVGHQRHDPAAAADAGADAARGELHRSGTDVVPGA